MFGVYVSFHASESRVNTGKWSSQEKSILIEGLKIYFNTNDLSKHIFNKNIEYRIISEIIDINRCDRDCWNYWKHNLR